MYIVSPASASAYKSADRMIMARIQKDVLRHPAAYEFFAGLEKGGTAIWSKKIDDRSAVFEDIGPGETASFPTKWMSPDGRSAWFLFSGDDCFSLRKAEFKP